MLSVALDTCLLVELNSWGRDTEEEHVPIELVSDLSALLRAGQANVLVDSGGKIQREYRRHLKDYELGHRLLRAAETSGQLTWRSDQLPAKVVRRLDADQFDPADRVFLDITHRIGALYVTAEIKHLRPARRKLVQDVCGVTIASLPELHERCSRARSSYTSTEPSHTRTRSAP